MDRNQKMQLDEAIETACAEMLLPLDAARAAAIEAGLGDGLRKRALRATA
jgi:hypothetical protein